MDEIFLEMKMNGVEEMNEFINIDDQLFIWGTKDKSLKLVEQYRFLSFKKVLK